ncbi:hypothetical protein OAA06_00725 [bacterium]|nr:hypothetical protein [bacterium]
MVQAEGATHAKFTIGVAAVDFDSKEYEVNVVQSAEMLVGDITLQIHKNDQLKMYFKDIFIKEL